MTVKELVFSDLNFELDYNQKVQNLTYDELLLVQDNVKVVETNLSLSLLTPISDFKDDYEWFDFGTSTEQNGIYLNTGLIKSKEEFGLSAICYDTYKLVLQ